MPTKTVSDPLMKRAKHYSTQGTMPLRRSRKRYNYYDLNVCYYYYLYRHLTMVCFAQLGILSSERESLLELWEVRRQQYEQCMDLQLFYRDTEQVDNWMSKQEVPDTPTGTKTLFKKGFHLCVFPSCCGGYLLRMCVYCVGFPPQ